MASPVAGAAPAPTGARAFSELGLPAPVARALAARSYEMAMPVQAAVLDPRCAGRDLLVSSQTGSGKTIAFGIAIGQSLLPEGRTKVMHGPRPVTLVIVPTRELAIQVRDELTWLLRETGARVASFTGGTAVGGDLAALKRGVDVVVGTPGRLVDLVRRERLDLADVGVLVLDEADEMLDLGFREDLETLLKAAPATRRTLLLSATLPREIREMARQFQRDALPIDPRRVGADGTAPVVAGAQAHDDIAYQAYLIAGGDRLAAVVNILRASNAERAIVFCTTRDGVGELHGALLARGFAATAISGERAQAERDRALDQVRRGEARVLVATNVAARGLHLPDVDLIIHADLPLNAESLTHRSGRTGRAGRKGTAVLLSTLTERRKAERLLSAVNVQAVWATPPSADAILRGAGDRLIDELSAEGDAVPPGREAAVNDFLQRLGAKLPPEELVRRLARRELERLPGGERLRPVALPAPGRAGFTSEPPAPFGRRRSPSEMSREGVVFRVNVGAEDKAEPRWLLPLICRRGGVTNREVGAIRVGPRETLFEIAGEAAAEFAVAAAETDPRAPHVRIERSSGRGPGRAPGSARRASPTQGPSTSRRDFAPSPSSAGARAPAFKARDGQPPVVKSFGSDEAPASAPPASAPVSSEVRPGDALVSGSVSSETRASAPPAHDAFASEADGGKPLPAGSAAGPSHEETSVADASVARKPHEDKPFASRPPAASKPAADRMRGDKPFASRGPGDSSPGDKPFARKPYGDKPFATKRYASRSPGEQPPGANPYPGKVFASKPYASHSSGDKPFGRKPHGDGPSASKPYASHSSGDKPFARRPAGNEAPADGPFGRKPYGDKPYGSKPFAEKSFGAKQPADRPRAEPSFAEKSHAGKPPRDRLQADRPHAARPPARRPDGAGVPASAHDRAAPYKGDRPHTRKPSFEERGVGKPRADEPHAFRPRAASPRRLAPALQEPAAGPPHKGRAPQTSASQPSSPRGREGPKPPVRWKRTSE